MGASSSQQGCLGGLAELLQSDSPVGTGQSQLPTVDNSYPYATYADAKGDYEDSGYLMEGPPDGRRAVFHRLGDIIATTSVRPFNKIVLGGIEADGGFRVGVAPAEYVVNARTININWQTYYYDEDLLYDANLAASVPAESVGLTVIGGPIYSQMIYLQVEPIDGGTEVGVDWLYFE